MDNLNFTFNGIGEYVFVQTPMSLDFYVQGRLRQFGETVNGTVLSAVVIAQGTVPPIQIQRELGEEIEIYVGGVKQELIVGQSPIIVSGSGVISMDVGGGIGLGTTMGDSVMEDSLAMSTTSDMVFVRVDDEFSVIVSTDKGASVSIAPQEEFLRVTVELPESFTNETAGILGVFNGDLGDDFRNRQGDVLNINASLDMDVYQFGLMCKYVYLVTKYLLVI